MHEIVIFQFRTACALTNLENKMCFAVIHSHDV
jgi:hypothetical protein